MINEGLPKDILQYILSIVVYDYYLSHYDHVWPSLISSYEMRIALLTSEGRFESHWSRSSMAAYLLVLSQTHPKIRSILKSATIPDSDNRWHFDEQFFHTLTRNHRI